MINNLLGESEMFTVKKSQLKQIIKEVLFKEATYLPEHGDYDKQLYFIKGDKVVTNISDDLQIADKAMKRHNANFQNKFGYGNLYVCLVKSKDWDAEKITTNTILRLAKDIQEVR